jgi:hypothetical protein
MRHPFANQNGGIISPAAKIPAQHGCDQGRMRHDQIKITIKRPGAPPEFAPASMLYQIGGELGRHKGRPSGVNLISALLSREGHHVPAAPPQLDFRR